MQSSNKTGYTLLEIMITIVIILGLAALAIPRFGTQVKRIRSSEAAQMLLIIFGEQKDYFRENNVYADDTLWSDLGIDKPTLDNFGAIVLDDGTTNLSCGLGGNVQYIARTTSNDGEYTLYALTSGEIACKPVTGTCPGSPCTNMGYGDFTP